MKTFTFKFLIILIILFPILYACADVELEPHSRIFDSAVWDKNESLKYELTRNGYVEGFCVVETSSKGDGVTNLIQICTDAFDYGYTDERRTYVKEADLQPISSLRIIEDPKKMERRHFSANYFYDDVKQSHVVFEIKEFKDNTDLPVRTLEVSRDLPPSSDMVPTPVWYDDDSIFWLIRGITYNEGFSASFTDVNAATGRVFSAHLKVERREFIEVPFGLFEVWKIKLETATIKQYLWVELESPHRIVRAKLEDLVYELISSSNP
tara:strand:+ start:754 stop:1551 length:798 start_codon:yes stop_codon:yes gene_type:complete